MPQCTFKHDPFDADSRCVHLAAPGRRCCPVHEEEMRAIHEAYGKTWDGAVGADLSIDGADRGHSTPGTAPGTDL